MFGNTTFDTIDILTFNTKLETIYGDDYHNIKLIDLLRKYFNVYYKYLRIHNHKYILSVKINKK